MPIPGYALHTVDEYVGKDLGVSDWTTIDQARIDQFSAATGDHQWIHIDVDPRHPRERPLVPPRFGASRSQIRSQVEPPHLIGTGRAPGRRPTHAAAG
jgi:hypothetical protein